MLALSLPRKPIKDRVESSTKSTEPLSARSWICPFSVRSAHTSNTSSFRQSLNACQRELGESLDESLQALQETDMTCSPKSLPVERASLLNTTTFKKVRQKTSGAQSSNHWNRQEIAGRTFLNRFFRRISPVSRFCHFSLGIFAG